MATSNKLIRGHQWAPRLQELLNNPPEDAIAWMETQTRPLKADTWSSVGLLQVQGEWCFAKLYHAKTAWQRLGFRLGYGRAVHSFDAAVKLAAAGLPVLAKASVGEESPGTAEPRWWVTPTVLTWRAIGLPWRDRESATENIPP